MRTLRGLIGFTLTFWIICPTRLQAQNCIPPPSRLAHWWRGEGNGFDTISIQDGVLIGGVQFGVGKVGTGFSFSGSGDDYIALPQNLFPMPDSGAGTDPFSFEVWSQTTVGGAILG